MKNLLKNKLKNNKGFTLIELMVVIVILLVLAAIAIPSYNRLVDEANETAATSEARTLYTLAVLESQTLAIDGATETQINAALTTEGADAETDAETDYKRLDEIYSDAGLATADGIVFTYSSADGVTLTYTSNGFKIVMDDSGTVATEV